MADNSVVKWAFAENMVTVAVCGAVVVALYYMGAGLHSLWGLVLMLNLNSFSTVRRGCGCGKCDGDKSGTQSGEG